MAVSTSFGWRDAPLPWQAQLWQRAGEWLRREHLPHAMLLHGVAGCGKQLFAQAFAALALCRHPRDGRACGECPACHQFAAGAHPDYHFVTLAEDKNAILVDQVRELCAALALTSLHGGRKIALLSPADAMNSNAGNSLLKTLEEPAAGSLLILVSAHMARLPATVRSRCQKLAMPAPDMQTALRWLKGLESRSDWPALLRIAGGGPLLALQLSQTKLGQERLDFYRLLLELRSGGRNPVTCAADLSREPLALVLRLLQAWTMDVIRVAALNGRVPPALTNDDAGGMLQSALKGLNLRALHAYLDCIGKAVGLASTAVNAQLLLEDLLVNWANGLRDLSVAPLAAREVWNS